MASSVTGLRADARRNIERVRSAAVEAFREHGLDAPLEDIARRAGVSVGTIYNRFGSREGLLDDVVAGLATDKLDAAIATASGADPWERFRAYVVALGEAQAADPSFNDVVSRRYPEAPALREVCDRAVAHGKVLMQAAQAEGSLRPDVVARDIDRLIWLNAQAIRLGGDWWRRSLGFFLDGLRADAGRP
ncbi:TetR/AcrR family transcriptional regulator [Pseudonocardia sp.]|jgi:AcrR family transcriptional regulator|uniref:TetR/AcrR family transcriptional regulator n=1 Tax=Pseudonocardia sp. TaxID=60912 RepID=UPI003D0CC1C6